jgi:hypothetical protein
VTSIRASGKCNSSGWNLPEYTSQDGSWSLSENSERNTSSIFRQMTE